MGTSGQIVVYLKSVQVMVRLHVFPIFSFLAKISAERWQHFCQKWKYRKNMQADNNLNRLYLKYLFTYLDNSGSIICFFADFKFLKQWYFISKAAKPQRVFQKNELHKSVPLNIFVYTITSWWTIKSFIFIKTYWKYLLKILIENTYWKYLLKILFENTYWK